MRLNFPKPMDLHRVQIHGLPMERLDEDNALLLRSKLGMVDKVDAVESNNPYLRVQVHFDIETPFHQGFTLNRE